MPETSISIAEQWAVEAFNQHGSAIAKRIADDIDKEILKEFLKEIDLEDMKQFLHAAISNITDLNIRIRIQDGEVFLIYGDRYYCDSIEAFLYPDAWERIGQWLETVG